MKKRQGRLAAGEDLCRRSAATFDDGALAVVEGTIDEEDVADAARRRGVDNRGFGGEEAAARLDGHEIRVRAAGDVLDEA